jgi:hypothetical protein
MFVYEVVDLFENGKAKVKYLEQVVKEGGNRYRVYKEGEKAQVRYVIFPLFVVCKDVSHKTLLFYSFFLNKFLTLKLREIATGHETWCEYNTRVNTRLSVARQELERSQQAEVIEVDADFTDINELFEKKGRGKHMLELEFLPTTTEGVTEPSPRLGKPIRVWVWKHKTTEAEIRRYPTHSGKGWDTGVLSRYLRSLKVSLHKVAYERAQRILSLNSKMIESVATESMIEKPILKREDLLKQWVSLSVLFFLFVLQNNSTGFLLSLLSSLRHSHHLSCRLIVGPRYYVLH